MDTKKESSRMKWLLTVVLVLGMSTLGYCFFNSYSWHQKMTIEVEVDGQLYSGSSVVSVRWLKNDPIGALHGPNWHSRIQGEAAFVEIPGRGVLFALLSFPGNTSYVADLPTRIMTGSKKGWARGNEEFSSVEAAKGQTLTVKEAYYPLFVIFTDITDPKTIKEVGPENMATTFGPGVSLKRITLEITDEDVTEGKIGPVLEWLDAVGDGMLDGRSISTIRAENRLANDLSRLNFRIGN